MEEAKEKRLMRLRNYTVENDIKYGGVLSYRHLRIAAWLCLALAQIGLSFKLTANLNPDISDPYFITAQVFSFFSAFPLPLFMLANFSVILRRRGEFRKLLIFYGGVAALLYGVGVFICSHYGYGVVRILDPDTSFGDASLMFGSFLSSLGSTGYIFNIFIDLFLCVLAFYFFAYNPKKYFQGKKIIIFRSFILIPVAYEVASMFLKSYMMLEGNSISFFLFFLLTSKPPLVFLSFIAVVVILKIKEVSYKKKFKGERQYSDFIKTNAHTFSTGIVMAVVFLVAALLDFFIVFLGVVIQCHISGDYSTEAMMIYYIPFQLLGLGESIGLILLVPISLLFNYRKSYKPSKIDMLIPVVGIGAVLIATIEGLFASITFTVERMRNIAAAEESILQPAIRLAHIVKDHLSSFIGRL